MTATNDELCLLSIEDAAVLIASKKLSPVELTEAVLARIERLNPALNAYITVTADAARAEAKAAEAEIAAGNYRGTLHGIPIAHKDLYDTKGVRTTAGMRVLADRVPVADGVVVAALRESGAICAGKLNMHEAAFGTSSANEHFGAVHNPWDAERVPGGSSGGSGVVVAAGMAFMATGSDTGGSIRIPASECGCVGLMPTYGRVSLRGIIGLSWTLDHAGPLTRSARDAAIALQAMAGHDPLDPTSVDAPVPDYLDRIERGPRGLRVGVPRQYFWDNIDPRVEASVRAAISQLEAAGAEVREIDFERAAFYSTLIGPIILVEAAVNHEPWFPARRDEYSAFIAGALDAAAPVSAAAYAKAMRSLQAARSGQADATLDGVDVLAVPTLPELPPTIAEMTTRFHDVRRTVYTSLLDVTGQPVITVPCGIIEERLPVSISFVARRWDEPTLLRAARAYEQVRGPFPAPKI